MNLSRRHFLEGVAALGLASAAPLSMPSSAAARGHDLPYTAGSFFKSRVERAPVDAERTRSFRAFMSTHPEQRNVPAPLISGQNDNQWGASFHVGGRTDPVWRLRNPHTETAILTTHGWHMPDTVVDRIPTGNEDRLLVVLDPVFGYTMVCGDAVANRATRTITATASAIFWHTSNGLDRRNPRSDDDRNFCSRGRIPDALVIRPDLVQAGIADGTGLGHVLELFLVETDSRTFGTGFVHPMVGTESRHTGGWGAEGERLRIDPSINLVARGLTGGALVIARTLQQHGAYIGDNSGSASTLKGAQSTATHNPYAGTNVTTDCLAGKITWDDFEVVTAGWQ
jgi:hypothetical protein